MIKRTSNTISAFGVISLIVLLLIGVMAVFGIESSDREQTENTTAEQSTVKPKLKWLEFYKDEYKALKKGDIPDMPEALVYVYLAKGYGYPDRGYGTVYGSLFNVSDKPLQYVEVNIGLYTKKGAKFGSCTAHTTYLKVNGAWEFEASCSDWRKYVTTRVDNVTYW